MNAGHSVYRWLWRPAFALALTALACGETSNVLDPGSDPQLSCTISDSEIFDGGPGKDGIPALTNPTFVVPGAPGTEYLLDEDRVIGLVVGNQALAIPLNIMWWHEIVNLDVGGRQLAVTHCPLTGSSLVFDRASIDGAELGVSGLLYQNNLIMYDRNALESLWPQMARVARCGSRSGAQLSMFPAWEMTWEGWRTLHPQTTVVSSATGAERNYGFYPYGAYDQINNRDLLFPQPQIDATRPPKERVLGIPDGEIGTAYPYGILESLGPVAAVKRDGDVVFWDSERQAAMAYSPILEGDELDFEFGQGLIWDTQTQSIWRLDGFAVSGPLAGKRLEPVAEAYVSYWFAWAAFHPNATLGITQ
jgi:hypothetical protein